MPFGYESSFGVPQLWSCFTKHWAISSFLSFLLNTFFFLLRSMIGYRQKVNMGPLQFHLSSLTLHPSPLESHLCNAFFFFFLHLSTSTPDGQVDFFSSHSCLGILPSWPPGLHLSALGSGAGVLHKQTVPMGQRWHVPSTPALVSFALLSRHVDSGDGSCDGSYIVWNFFGNIYYYLVLASFLKFFLRLSSWSRSLDSASTAGDTVWSQVWELRFHMPCSTAQNKYINKNSS